MVAGGRRPGLGTGVQCQASARSSAKPREAGNCNIQTLKTISIQPSWWGPASVQQLLPFPLLYAHLFLLPHVRGT